jgi:hypothetical protein
MVCNACAVDRSTGQQVAVDLLCADCYNARCMKWCCAGEIRRAPEVRELGAGLHEDIVEVPIPRHLSPILDFAPVPMGWLFLTADGTVSRFDTKTRNWNTLARVPLRREPQSPTWDGHNLTHRLHGSDDGRFVAVVNDYGQYGIVWDLQTSKVTIELDGGHYHQETVPFSFAFTHAALAVHRTDWNRLDISDPATGELLSRRGPTSFWRGEQRPEHYLDYFHGRLLVSRDGAYVADDGWAWQPNGIPSVWSLEEWVHRNVWESEDGPSRREPTWRENVWDCGMCWLDGNRLAIWGLGEEEDLILPGVRIFAIGQDEPDANPNRPRPLEKSFAGPDGRFFSDGQRLFSVDTKGLSAWDVEREGRIGQFHGFRPTHANPGTGELAELNDGVLRLWRM